MQNSKKQIGIIGCGHWGPNYIRTFNKLPMVTVAKCCDVNPDSLSRIRDIYPDIELVADYTQILNDEQIEAVVVSTPASTHFEIIKECLKHSKDVLAEKPLTLLAKESSELVRLAEKQDSILMVGHTFLYNQGVLKLKDYVSNDHLGKIYYLNATRTHLGLIRRDVNAVWDLAPHDVAIMNYLTDTMPAMVNATGACHLKKDREDVAFINLIYPNDIIANIHVSWADSNKERSIRVVGSKARVVFNDLDNLEMVKLYEKGVSVERPYDDFGEFQLNLRDGDILSPKIDMHEPLMNMCKHFLKCITERKKPLTDGVNGYEVVKVMAAIEQSMEEKKYVSLD